MFQVDNKKKLGLRIAWIVPQVFLSLLDTAFLIFLVLEWENLGPTRDFFYGLLWLLLTAVIIYGFIKIGSWIKEGKM
ncbi:hypothetical protein D7M11_35600 [Paenibacillus ginsengarvi]|uniref:Uncharacterized protein n=1 Tax=Paenibacillus ginsengarvi TaxID=400777 RepID=A0A3B0AKV5_9BACL|nr:hypothetical protein D7M11_35600 [Paenibacillus ginsengarvi]